MTEEKWQKWANKKVREHQNVKIKTTSEIKKLQQYKPKKAVKQARYQKKQAKLAVKKAQKNYALVRRTENEVTVKEAKQKLINQKMTYKIKKKAYQSMIKRNGGSAKKKIAVKGHQVGRRTAEAMVSDNDTLGDIANTRQTIRHTHRTIEQNKKLLKYSQKIAEKTVKNSYGLSNRTYNLVKGNGFTRTPKVNRWETQLKNRVNALKRKVFRSKLGKTTRTTKKVANIISRPFLSILKNPLTIKSYFLIFFIIVIFAIISSMLPTPIQQDEFDLNKSWLQISKRDREKSNDKVDYWTNINDIIHVMNFKYGSEWSPDSTWDDGTGGQLAGITGFNHYSDALNDLWNYLNEDTENLKTIDDLVVKNSVVPWLKLSKKDLENYKELKELVKEIGYYPNYQELENLFYDASDEANYNAPLVILKRYGYTTVSKIYEGSQIKANKGQTLRAVFNGTVTIDGDDLTIKTKEAKFTYKNISSIRVKNGDKVTEGQEIGAVKTEGYQEIFYKKKEVLSIKDLKKVKWTAVNPGFYFQNVVYNQTTSVLTNLSGDLGEKARKIKDYLKPKIPGLTDNGLAAMLGNFATESNINPKRAEGDYLNPPIGATDSSWDDINWLSLNGPAIYNGSFPNILRRGLGLGQWTDTADGAVRHTLLLDYANKKGKKWYDLELQLDFMIEGDSPYYINNLKSILTSNEDVSVLTKRFLNNWEGNAGDKLLERQNNAKQIYGFLTSEVRGGGSLASSFDLPEAYRDRLKNPPSTASMTAQRGNGYPIGQCTWYAYNRLVELGSITDLSGTYGYLGNGGNWVASLVAKGWKYSSTPKPGAVVSTAGGFDFTTIGAGHVGIVEVVNSDGSFLVSELNYAGVQNKVHYRVCQPAIFYTFATPN